MDIIKTYDYRLFKNFDNNRPIYKSHVKRLEKSIEECGLKDPIKCIKKDFYYYIADGQHRFIALKNLNKQIITIVSNIFDSHSVLTMNTYDKDWTVTDYVNRFAKEKNPTYLRLLELYEVYRDFYKDGTINQAFDSNSGGGTTYRIKNSLYQLNEDLGKKTLQASISCYKTNFKKEFLSTKFVRALKMIISKNKYFDTKILLRKLQKRKIVIYNNEGDIKTEIKECYNYNNKKNRIV